MPQITKYTGRHIKYIKLIQRKMFMTNALFFKAVLYRVIPFLQERLDSRNVGTYGRDKSAESITDFGTMPQITLLQGWRDKCRKVSRNPKPQVLTSSPGALEML